MSTPISVKEKQDFIQWFLRRYELKKRESVWIFKYLLTHASYLAHIHFVRDVRCCPRGMIVSTFCSNNIAFRYHKMHIVTDDPDQTFHDIRLNKYEPLYIQLNFNYGEQHPLYVTVLEDNPFEPTNHINRKNDAVVAGNLLDHIIYTKRKNILQHQIDVALDENDRELFLQLSSELSRLERKQQDNLRSI